MKNVKKILSNSWTITLVGILVGGLAGVYLNGYFLVRKEKRETSKAFDRVIEELTNNHDRMIQWDSTTKKYFKCVTDMSTYAEDGSNWLVLSPIEKKALLDKHGEVLILTDTVPTATNKTKYYWEMELKINLSKAIFPYNAYAWESFKNSQFLKYIDFDCITEIEALHQTYQQATNNKAKWFELYLTNQLKVNKGKKILLHWQLERVFNKQVIDYFPDIKEKLEKCS